MTQTGVCQPIGTSVDPDASDAPVSPPDGASDWWDLAWTHRRAIDVVAGDNGTPARYSLSITFDHDTLVDTGEALASGDDVRIVRADGVEVERVLDSGSDWRSPTTTVWFAHEPALADNAAVRYYLYYGNPSAGAPPENASKVFLLADGFEGTLSQWFADASVGRTTSRAHSGTHAVRVPPQDQTGVGISAMDIDERDVVLDAWWNLEVALGADVSMGIRENATSVYFTDLQQIDAGQPSVWDISKFESDTYTELVPAPPGAPGAADDTWTRVTIYAYRHSMALDIDGQRYVPESGFATVDADLSGTVGMGAYLTTGDTFFDDVTLRRFVLPEPTVTLGPDETP